MSKSSIFIPKRINVGYQNRSGTYTGKLAYIIYYDERGKLRKETSWNNWRNKEIPNEEFENVPTEGFVLNKKVGDYDSGWNHRHAYCRVYDPRNFEFEITIENLLYILENANSIKGKGLEGEFVYGWDGKDLVLIPVDSPDYKQLIEFNEIVQNKEKIRAKDLIIGATYLNKNNQEFIYIGKFDYYTYGYKWEENGEIKISAKYSDIPNDLNNYGYRRKINYDYIDGINQGKYFWFAYRGNENKWNITQYRNVSEGKFIKCLDNNCHQEYADIYDLMETYSSFSPYDESKDKYFSINFEEFKQRGICTYRPCNCDINFIGEYNGNRCNWRARPVGEGLEDKWILQKENVHNREKYYNCYENDYEVFPYETKIKEEREYYWSRTVTKEVKTMIPVTLKEIFDKIKPLYKQKYLKNGREYERKYIER